MAAHFLTFNNNISHPVEKLKHLVPAAICTEPTQHNTLVLEGQIHGEAISRLLTSLNQVLDELQAEEDTV